MSLLDALLHDYTLRTVALGAAVLGITAGALGCFAMLRRQSLLGDAISHASLAGVTGAFLLTGYLVQVLARSGSLPDTASEWPKAPIVLLAGAGIVGWIASVFAELITRRTQLKMDAALGIVLSVFFGLGVMLLTLIQRLAGASQAGLDKFLFGNASTLLQEDVIVMATLGGAALFTLAFLWKGFKIATFDPDYAATLGLPVSRLNTLLLALIVAAIVTGLQTVGVVLMSAMLVAPAAAARQWTDRLGHMVLLAAGFGALSGISGAILSAQVPKLPTGPTIVLIVSTVVLLSMLLAPNRGLLWNWIRARTQRLHLEASTVLSGMLRLAEAHDDPFHPHNPSALRALTGVPVQRGLRELQERGLVTEVQGERWALTQAGLEQAQREANGEAQA